MSKRFDIPTVLASTSLAATAISSAVLFKQNSTIQAKQSDLESHVINYGKGVARIIEENKFLRENMEKLESIIRMQQMQLNAITATLKENKMIITMDPTGMLPTTDPRISRRSLRNDNSQNSQSVPHANTPMTNSLHPNPMVNNSLSTNAPVNPQQNNLPYNQPYNNTQQ